MFANAICRYIAAGSTEIVGPHTQYMNALLRSACGLMLAALAAFANPSVAQSKKFYLQPDMALGLTSGYNYGNALKLEPGKMNGFFRLECRVGYYFNNNLSMVTGLGFATYRYHMVIDGSRIETGHPDMTRDQEQSLLEIPLGLRFTTYNAGLKQFKTRYYYGGGLRLGLLNDGRFDYKTVGGGPSGYEVQPDDFNTVHARLYLEGGIDVPIDYNSAFVCGLNISQGITRNMRLEGEVGKANYGLLAYGINFGFRFGL
jgi:hypothetical protein